MPTYEYECEPCRVIYETRHGVNDRAPAGCPRCGAPVNRLMSAPNLKRGNYASPTEAKYAKMSTREEVAREKVLQKDYERIWLPPPVKHSPWDEGA
jgi:putative FmdB family regulatory protein